MGTRHTPPPPTGSALRDERGAVLVLAMLLLVAMSLLVTSLLTVTSTGLVSANGLRQSRNTQYAAAGAVDLAIQSTRYSSSTYQTAGACSPGPSNVVTINGSSFVVYCSGVYDYYSTTGATRTITFTSCPSSQSMAQCTQPVVTAVVAFNDWSSTNTNECSGSETATCGTGMTIESWVVL